MFTSLTDGIYQLDRASHRCHRRLAPRFRSGLTQLGFRTYHSFASLAGS